MYNINSSDVIASLHHCLKLFTLPGKLIHELVPIYPEVCGNLVTASGKSVSRRIYQLLHLLHSSIVFSRRP